jgi:hypothetical protein
VTQQQRVGQKNTSSLIFDGLQLDGQQIENPLIHPAEGFDAIVERERIPLSGRLSRIDNCQVGILSVLANSTAAVRIRIPTKANESQRILARYKTSAF